MMWMNDRSSRAESSAIPLNSLNFASYSAMLSDLKWNVSIDTLRKFQMTTNDIAHDVYAMKNAVHDLGPAAYWVVPLKYSHIVGQMLLFDSIAKGVDMHLLFSFLSKLKEDVYKVLTEISEGEWTMIATPKGCHA